MDNKQATEIEQLIGTSGSRQLFIDDMHTAAVVPTAQVPRPEEEGAECTVRSGKNHCESVVCEQPEEPAPSNDNATSADVYSPPPAAWDFQPPVRADESAVEKNYRSPSRL